MDDEQLAEAALEGDDTALKELHDRYVRQIYQYAYVQTGNHHDAEEVTQDIFYKMASGLHMFNGRSRFRTWLFAIGRNAVIDYRRSQKKHRNSMALPLEKLEPLVHGVKSVEAQAVRQDLTEEVMLAMNELPEEQQTVLHLRFIEGFSIKETGQIMSKTSFAVKSLQYRASKKIAEIIRNEVGFHA